MGLFRNVTVFEYTEEGQPVNLTDLEFAAANYPARTPEKNQRFTIGFVPALFGQALELIHVADAGRYAMAKVRIEEKRVPPSLLREEVARKYAEVEKREGVPPTREQIDALRMAVEGDLMARAFPRARVVRVLFLRDAGLVLVGTATKSDVDEVVGLIRQALGTFPIQKVSEVAFTRTMLTKWVKHGAPHVHETGFGFHLGEAAVLRGRPVKGEGSPEVVTLRNAHLRSPEVEQHIEAKKDVLRLAFTWRMSDDVAVDGSVDAEFVLRGLKTHGAAPDHDDGADMATIYAAEFYAEAAVLERLIEDLRPKLLTGRQPVSGGGAAGEREVRIAANLYKARDEMRDLLGDLYGKKMAEFGEVLRGESEKLGKDILATAIDVAKRQLSTVQQKMALAAAVELIEPTVEV